MDTTLSKPLTPDAKPATALPVLDLLNNLITVASTIGTAAKTTLPKSIINANPSLATAFTEWQDAAWQMLYEALVDARIFAEATEINSVFNEGITDQSVFQSLIMLDNGVPSVIAGCDDLEGNINQGLTLLSQLQTVASNIANADKQQIAQIQSLVDSLNTQFDSLEDKLDEKALDNSNQAVTTIINV
ncbi:MAG: hypothetical protein OXE99_11635 [Cellvibrionales bacterium]|nr:hypothetical protein [Cellvibrionales bacterium]